MRTTFNNKKGLTKWPICRSIGIIQKIKMQKKKYFWNHNCNEGDTNYKQNIKTLNRIHGMRHV